MHYLQIKLPEVTCDGRAACNVHRLLALDLDDLPRCLLHQELQTGQIPACCRAVSRHGSAVRLHSRCCADTQQPLDDAPAAKARRQVQWGGASSVLVLQAHRDQSGVFVVDAVYHPECNSRRTLWSPQERDQLGVDEPILPSVAPSGL